MIDPISNDVNTTNRRIRPVGLAVLGGITGLTLAACGTSYQPGPVSDSTACGVVNADHAGGDDADITRYLSTGTSAGTGSLLSEGQIIAAMQVLPTFLSECAAHPSELAAAAKSAAIPATPPTPTCPEGQILASNGVCV